MTSKKNLFREAEKTHKNQLIVMPSGQEIVDVLGGNPGLTSDINIWRDRQICEGMNMGE